MGTFTGANVWQREAAKALAELLDQAAKCALPKVFWQLGEAGTLAGKLLGPDMRARQVGFLAWADFLRINDWRAWESSGVTRMHGIAKADPGGPRWRRCRITLTADLYDNGNGGKSS